MAYENKPGTGALFKNDKKGNEKAPDYTGSFVAHRDIKAGEEISSALWTTKSKAGMNYFHHKISDKMTPVQAPPPPPVVAGDELPF